MNSFMNQYLKKYDNKLSYTYQKPFTNSKYLEISYKVQMKNFKSSPLLTKDAFTCNDWVTKIRVDI